MTKNAISWHPADVRAAVSKAGSTLAKVAEGAGLHVSTAQQALKRPCYAGEQAIARFLGVPAHHIWPARYDSAGLPKHPRIRKQLNAEISTVECQKELAA